MIGLLRVKNEARWIERVLRSIQPICERILVMDDHSTDSTADLARKCGAEVLGSPFEGCDEARDKDWLLSHAGVDGFALMIDGDEELHPDDARIIRAVCGNPYVDVYALRVLYLWNDEKHVRMDGVYGQFSRPSLFRLRPGLSFRRTDAGANFHCSNVPAQYHGSSVLCDARLLHYGYMHQADRLRKYEWYNATDPGNSGEDFYRHVVIGDVFPAESQMMWAGPLRLEAI